MKRTLLILIFCFIFVNIALQIKAHSYFEDNYKVYNPQDTKGVINKIDNKSNVIFIVDYSNSMNEKLGGKSKLHQAIDTLQELVEKMPDNINTGLRIYGYNGGVSYLFGCYSSKLFVPLGKNNKNDMVKALYSTTAIGWTPITYSLKQAVNKDFMGVEGKKHIVLLTDGGENCDESPCTFAINLMKLRDDISIDVVAFDMNDYEAKNQLRCTATVTKGKFFEAKDAEELKDSLFDSLNIDKSVKGQVKIHPSLF